MERHPLAGKPVPPEMWENIPYLVSSYYIGQSDVLHPQTRVSFGTSGHRGSSRNNSFNEDHILAITQAICDYRVANGIEGPLYLGKDTHALSEPAFRTALEVLAANCVTVMIDSDDGYTPTPVISHAILKWNNSHKNLKADGIIITPSHNPPDNGGFKYNPPTGGPADKATTTWIADRANHIIDCGLAQVRRISHRHARHMQTTKTFDYIASYVDDLQNILNMDIIKSAGLKICADALGGSGLGFWEPIAERYGLDITVRNQCPDPTFRFMRVDHDGNIRMDCSSPDAMSGLIDLKDDYDIAFGNDPDFDRHGIVTASSGLLNPNHYLSVSIWYLFQNRDWSENVGIGKTLVSSSMIDRIAHAVTRPLVEVPVGFKWFVDGLLNGSLGFGGEESAGASFLRKDGSTWTTDKDGIIMSLLAAEIMAKTERDPGEIYTSFTEEYGEPVYQRIESPAKPEEKDKLRSLSAGDVRAEKLAGDDITNIMTTAPGNDAPIGGLKVVTEHGWFAARPSGTENIYKIYTESFRDEQHLKNIQAEAKSIVQDILAE